MHFSDVFRDADELLAIEVEELARIVLEYLKTNADRKGTFNRHNFSLPATVGSLGGPNGLRTIEVAHALMEAWSFLEQSGAIVPDAGQDTIPGHERYVVSRRGRAISSEDDWNRFLNARRLPEFLLHPLVREHAYPNFIRGAYDAAVLEAFKSLEVRVRERGKLPPDRIGVDLMSAAFKAGGPLRDANQLEPEANATASIFLGAIGLWRNPVAHRSIGLDHVEAGQLLIVASRLLSIVDTAPATAGP